MSNLTEQTKYIKEEYQPDNIFFHSGKIKNRHTLLNGQGMPESEKVNDSITSGHDENRLSEKYYCETEVFRWPAGETF